MADLRTMCWLRWTIVALHVSCRLFSLIEVCTAAENVNVVDYSGYVYTFLHRAPQNVYLFHILQIIYVSSEENK